MKYSETPTQDTSFFNPVRRTWWSIETRCGKGISVDVALYKGLRVIWLNTLVRTTLRHDADLFAELRKRTTETAVRGKPLHFHNMGYGEGDGVGVSLSSDECVLTN